MVVSVAQAGELLGCGRSRVFELLAAGVLERAPRYGRALRIYLASVNRALQPAPVKRRQRRAPSCAGWEISDVPLEP